MIEKSSGNNVHDTFDWQKYQRYSSATNEGNEATIPDILTDYSNAQ